MNPIVDDYTLRNLDLDEFRGNLFAVLDASGDDACAKNLRQAIVSGRIHGGTFHETPWFVSNEKFVGCVWGHISNFNGSKYYEHCLELRDAGLQSCVGANDTFSPVFVFVRPGETHKDNPILSMLYGMLEDYITPEPEVEQTSSSIAKLFHRATFNAFK